MSVSNYYNNIVKVERLETTTGYKKAHVVIIEDLDVHIQPLTADLIGADGIFGKDFLMFTSYVDIQEQDRIFDSSDNEYRVQGVEKYDFRGQTRHVEVRIRINDQPDK